MTKVTDSQDENPSTKVTIELEMWHWKLENRLKSTVIKGVRRTQGAKDAPCLGTRHKKHEPKRSEAHIFIIFSKIY